MALVRGTAFGETRVKNRVITGVDLKSLSVTFPRIYKAVLLLSVTDYSHFTMDFTISFPNTFAEPQHLINEVIH